jgi:hypothetical protein
MFTHTGGPCAFDVLTVSPGTTRLCKTRYAVGSVVKGVLCRKRSPTPKRLFVRKNVAGK